MTQNLKKLIPCTLLFGMACQFSSTGGSLILLIVAAACLLFVMAYGSGWFK
jgi:hypothetical protein